MGNDTFGKLYVWGIIIWEKIHLRKYPTAQGIKNLSIICNTYDNLVIGILYKFQKKDIINTVFYLSKIGIVGLIFLWHKEEENPAISYIYIRFRF